MDKRLIEIMRYLANEYAWKIKSYYDKEDLFNDLVVVYLERNKKRSLNEWFVIFKNYLIDKQRRKINEAKAIGRLREESIIS